MIRLGKANSVFGRLGRIWASKKISVMVETRLYESQVLFVLLHGAETWPMKKESTRKPGSATIAGYARSCTSHGRTKQRIKLYDKSHSKERGKTS